MTSSTHERKSKTNIFVKGGRIYLHHNTLTDDVPICIVFKAMGVVSDQEIVQLIGSQYADLLAASIQECSEHHIFTELQALDYMGGKIRDSTKKPYGYRKSRADFAREALSNMIISHISVVNFQFQPKCVYIALMVRRVVQAMKDPKMLDDKDYYGNKRLEL